MNRKTVLITGASRGIGAATARLFATHGCGVAINYNRSRENALRLLNELKKNGIPAIAIQADVSDAEQVKYMVDTTSEELGHIDMLVNNAGISQIKLFTDITGQEFDRMISVNLKGVFNCTQAVLPDMLHRKSGSIVNVSSVWGMHGASCEVHYSASKAGIIGLTKALALELAPSGIRVNCVAPGAIDTEMNRSFNDEERHEIENEIPLGRFGTVDEVARTIWFLASDEASYTTGAVIEATGGMV